jgi:hypothetical protein
MDKEIQNSFNKRKITTVFAEISSINRKQNQKLSNQILVLEAELESLKQKYEELLEENIFLYQKLNKINKDSQNIDLIPDCDIETLATAATQIKEHVWDVEVKRILQSSKLNRAIRFSLHEFRELLDEITPQLNQLTAKGQLRSYKRKIVDA